MGYAHRLVLEWDNQYSYSNRVQYMTMEDCSSMDGDLCSQRRRTGCPFGAYEGTFIPHWDELLYCAPLEISIFSRSYS